MALGLAVTLAACSSPSEGYPELGVVSNIKARLLSREEQKQAIQQLELEQETQAAARHQAERK